MTTNCSYRLSRITHKHVQHLSALCLLTAKPLLTHLEVGWLERLAVIYIIIILSHPPLSPLQL